MASAGHGWTLYVIDLQKAVLRDKKFRAANATYRERWRALSVSQVIMKIRKPNTSQGGFANKSESLEIQSYNVVARRKALHRVWKENFVPLVAEVFLRFPAVRGFGNDDLVVMQCSNHSELEDVVKHLLRRGLIMTRNNSFEDFAIMHGTHGLALPCAWLDFKQAESGGTIRLKPEQDLLNLVDAEYGYEGPALIMPMGRGFVVSQEEDHDVWVDFTTGATVITLRSGDPVAA